MVSPDIDFQRARRPEQVRARRAAILAMARTMLCERTVADISLRELSDRVGLAKSNVLRYFDSREAIFLEVLDDVWTCWLAEIEAELPAAVDGVDATVAFARETAIASTVAASLLRQPLLCELISVMAGVLEKNISIDYARTFKRKAAANSDRLATAVRALLPHLSASAATHFAGAAAIIIAGIWPYARPNEAVAEVMVEMGSPTGAEMFRAGLTEGLINQLIGLSVRAGGPELLPICAPHED